MALTVNTNRSSNNTQRWLGISGAGQAKALERLSSGYKINKASDDAAGIAIATKLNVKSASMAKAIDNGNQGLSMLQTAEGGIDQLSNILTRLKEIATQSASDNTTDRTALNTERGNLELEITKISVNTRYGTVGLLRGAGSVAGYGASITAANGFENIDVSNAAAGNFTLTTTAIVGGVSTLTLTNGTTTQSVAVSGLTGLGEGTANFSDLGVKVTVNAATVATAASNGFSVTAGTSQFDFQVGDTNSIENQIQVAIGDFSLTGTVLNISGDISTKALAKVYMNTIDTAIGNLTTERGKVGAAMNQIGYHVANLETMTENTKAAESTIKDADFAAEMASFTKYQILNQSGIAMLTQANQLPQQILSLLRG
jgi:flagellin